uniref:Major facilitator superfamily (MFS) profile domain-containing protein n=1 Tax=Ascaris lumbricoides TaxID=6252 RepID=A0A9J2PMA2_ASCLU
MRGETYHSTVLFREWGGRVDKGMGDESPNPKDSSVDARHESKDTDRESGSKNPRNEADVGGGYTGPLLLAVFASTIGGSFQFGYHIGCVNVPQQVIKEWYLDSYEHIYGNRPEIEEIAKWQWGITVALFAVGGMIGGLASGWAADHFGRKGAMLANNFVAVLAAVSMSIARYVKVYHLIMIGRVIIGINAGASSGLVPMYLTEISPVNLRGTIGSVNQLLVTVAILFSQIIGLPQLLGSEQHWPLIFAFTAVPVLVQACTLPFCVESPKYNLLVREHAEQAEEDLKKLRAKDEVTAEMKMMREEAAAMAAVGKVGIADMFRGIYAWPMFIAIMMMLAQQFSGINVAMFFSTSIFEGAGLGSNAVYATLGMGTCNVAMTVISVYLNKDTLNNQWASYPSMVLVFLFVISFATGPGSIPWFFVSELFDSGARGGANSIAACVNWTSNFIVGISWEFLNQSLNQYAFLIFATFLAFFIFFVWVYVPETKGRSIEDIKDEMKRGKSIWARQRQH